MAAIVDTGMHWKQCGCTHPFPILGVPYGRRFGLEGPRCHELEHLVPDTFQIATILRDMVSKIGKTAHPDGQSIVISPKDKSEVINGG